MRSRTNSLVMALLALGLLVGTALPAGAQQPSGPWRSPGAPGVGDEYFPLAGNGGYDVEHYALDLSYEPDSGRLEGVAGVTAVATQDLTSFHLDLRDLQVARVRVNGRPRFFTHRDQELVVSTRPRLRAGQRFDVVVEYAGFPQPLVDATEAEYGWIPTDDGSFVANEPDGAPTWYPVNDPDRQGHLHLPGHGPRGDHGGRERRADLHRDRGRPVDVHLGRRRADGELPVDGVDRGVRAAPDHHAVGSAADRRHRRRPGRRRG